MANTSVGLEVATTGTPLSSAITMTLWWRAVVSGITPETVRSTPTVSRSTNWSPISSAMPHMRSASVTSFWLVRILAMLCPVRCCSSRARLIAS